MWGLADFHRKTMLQSNPPTEYWFRLWKYKVSARMLSITGQTTFLRSVAIRSRRGSSQPVCVKIKVFWSIAAFYFPLKRLVKIIIIFGAKKILQPHPIPLHRSVTYSTTLTPKILFPLNEYLLCSEIHVFFLGMDVDSYKC